MVKKYISKNGFTLLELVIAVFLLAIVLAGGILLLASNLNVMKKANELTIARAIAEYMIEELKNIDFPPIYWDGSKDSKFGDRPINVAVYKLPEEIDPLNDGNDYTPEAYKNDFITRKYDFRYDTQGNFLQDPTVSDTDITQLHRIDIYVLRRKGRNLILKITSYISRNGMY